MRHVDAFCHFFPQGIFTKLSATTGGTRDIGKRIQGVRTIYDLEARFRIMDGYGATECAPVLAGNSPLAYRPQTVGRFLAGIEHRNRPAQAEEGRFHLDMGAGEGKLDSLIGADRITENHAFVGIFRTALGEKASIADRCGGFQNSSQDIGLAEDPRAGAGPTNTAHGGKLDCLEADIGDVGRGQFLD